MNKEPIGLYIFRYIVGLGLFIFMAMLYWSTLLIEQDLKYIQTDMHELKHSLLQTQEEMSKFMTHTPVFQDQAAPQPKRGAVTQSSHIDPSLPNLLSEDPFYVATLPKMLGTNFKPHGTFRLDSIGKPINLHPFNGWIPVAEWVSQCLLGVAKMHFGKYETMAPDMALKMEERINKDTGAIEYWVHLRNDVYWSPLKKEFLPSDFSLAAHFLKKHPVTAHDFKFNFDAIMNPQVQEPQAVAMRTYYVDLEDIKVIDDRTFVVQWKNETFTDDQGKTIKRPKYIAKQLTGQLQPLAAFVFQYFADGKKIIEDDTAVDTYRKNSVWAQNFNQHWAKNVIISCGPWLFDGMTDRQIRFIRNPDYFYPLEVLADAMEIEFKDSVDGVWQDFKSMKTDRYILQPEQLLEYENFIKSPKYKEQEKSGNAIKRLDYLARSYAYIGWNQNNVFFKSKKVRQAMTMAIDRKRIIAQNLNSMGVEITGPLFRYSDSYDESISPWPYDPLAAKSLLEEEGWFDSDSDGIIDKVIDGKKVPFQFNFSYYVKNPTAKAIAEYVSTALREIGVQCNLNGVDSSDLTNLADDKSFEAIYLGWALGTPPEDPRQLWSSAGAKEKGSSNLIGFANTEVDEIINKLQFEYNKDKRRELYHRFGAILHDEAPYTFLYSPKSSLLYREYLQNVFIPADRQDLIPGADVSEPSSSIYWIKKE